MEKKFKVIGIHGNSSSASVFKDFNWCDKAVSLPGHDNTPLDKDFNLPNLVSFLKSEIGNEPVVLVGQSLGGNLAFELINEPNVLGVIASSAPPINYDTVGQGWKPSEYLALYFTEDLSEKQVEQLAKLNTSNPEAITKVISAFNTTNPKIRSDVDASMKAGHLNDEVQLVRDSNKPVLLLYGKQDEIVNGEYLENLGFGTVKGIEGAHNLGMDSPDEYSKCVIDFLGQI